MEKRKIAGRKVGPIGWGAMPLDEYHPKPSDEEAIRVLKHAIELGVDFIDTADVYGLGRNERLIGEALKPEHKESVLIATKGGCTRPGGTGWGTDGNPEHIKKAIRDSLKRLDIKQVELYQLHAPDYRVPLRDSIKALKELQDNGFIKHIGVSNFSLIQLKEAQKYAEIVSVQNHFNLSQKKDEDELLPYLTDNKIAYIPYFPLGSGRIVKDPRIIEIAARVNMTPSQLALGWIITKWPTAIPIPGTRSQLHIYENLKAADIELDEETINELDSLY